MLEVRTAIRCSLYDGGYGGDATCALCMLEAVEVPEVIDVCSLYAGVCGGWALFTRDVEGAAGAGGAGGDALRGTLYAGGCGRDTLVAGGDALCLLEAPEVLDVREAVEGGLSFEVSKFLLWQFSPPLSREMASSMNTVRPVI